MSVFKHEKVVQANEQLQLKLQALGGKMKMGVMQLASGEQVLETQSLMSMLARLQGQLLDVRRENIVLGAAVKIMLEGLGTDPEFIEGMAGSMVSHIEKDIEALEKMLEEQRRKELMPDIKLPPGFQGRNGN